MRHLWTTRGDTELKYTPADLERGLAELTRDPAFAKAFFDGSVHASGLPDYAPLLRQAGLLVRPVDATRGWAGMSLVDGEGGVGIGDAPRPDAPAYAGGLERGDVLLGLDGAPVRDAAAAQAVLAGHRPGDRVAVRFRQRGVERDAVLRLAINPSFEVVRGETAGAAVTPAQMAFREGWLGK
jgi:predicted metalloprotease with PDZ domain